MPEFPEVNVVIKKLELRTLNKTIKSVDVLREPTIEGDVEHVKKTLEGTDTDAIKNATEKLTTVFYEISQKLYQEAQKQSEAQGETTADAEGVVHDADYKVEDESENK